MLPADTVPLMRPWGLHAQEKFPNFKFSQNQLHGPIFEYYSWRYVARERILTGEVPLWNPYELGGNVLLANSQSAVLYPPNAALYLFSLPMGINLVTLFHTLLTGMSMYWLIRLWKLQPVPALTGALIWMFCGLQIVWTEFQTPTAVLAWLPLLLVSWEKFAQTTNWRWSILLGSLCVSMVFLAGHLQFAFYVLLTYAIYALFRTSSIGTKDKWNFRKVVAILFASLSFGFAIAAVTMIPVLEMGKMNFRSGNTQYAASTALRIPYANLLTLAQPNLLGSPRDFVEYSANGLPVEGHNYVGSFDFIEYCCYLGIPGLILGLIGLLYTPTRMDERKWRSDRFVAGIAIIGLMLALGTLICAFFFYGVPGYSQFNATARALSMFSFGMAGLAAYGVQHFIDRSRGLTAKLGISTLCVLAIGVIALPGNGSIHPKLATEQWVPYAQSNFNNFLTLFALFALSAFLVTRNTTREQKNRFAIVAIFPVIAVADLWISFARFNPVTRPAMLGYETAIGNYLPSLWPDRVVSKESPELGIKSIIVPNYNAVVPYREVQGADSLHLKRYHQLIEKTVLRMEPGKSSAFTDANTVRVHLIDNPLFDLLNVKYVLVAPADNMNPDRFTKSHEGELDVWTNPRACGPAWFVKSATKIKSLVDVVDRMNYPGFNPRFEALVETDMPPLSASGGTVEQLKLTPHTCTASVISRGNSLLVASEIAYPGWQVTIDDKPAESIIVDYVLRGVVVPEGKHAVRWSYNPTSYRFGLYLTSLALLIWSGIAVFSLCARRLGMLK